ncbi:hypothetical protein FGB62_127g13 [Gracilaria domingensis]|nr:hypothetical protein FGB62_127g13 [Gracilaria domingensis]
MADEYDPENFSVRVSQSLIKVLTGQASEPGPIQPRNAREASLVEALRREGRLQRMVMLREMKDSQLKEADEREQKAREALTSSVTALDKKLNDLNFPSGASETFKPCAAFRERITTCYKVNGKDNPLACAGEVEAFSECAKQLSRISN